MDEPVISNWFWIGHRDLPIHAAENGQDGTANTEPTLELLSTFGECLKGKKVTLYASAKGSFAHHLSSYYLTTRGMKFVFFSPDGQMMV